MKKLLVLLGILAAFSFVACNKEADPINPPASDPIENEDTGDNGAVEDEGTTGGDSTEDSVEKVKISLDAGFWCWNYNAETKNDTDSSLLVTIKASAGTGSFGYKPVVDWSEYSSLVFELGEKTNFNGAVWAQAQIKDGSGKYATGLMDVTKTAQTVVVDFTKADAGFDVSKINQIWVQAGTSDAIIHVVDCYLLKK